MRAAQRAIADASGFRRTAPNNRETTEGRNTLLFRTGGSNPSKSPIFGGEMGGVVWDTSGILRVNVVGSVGSGKTAANAED